MTDAEKALVDAAVAWVKAGYFKADEVHRPRVFQCAIVVFNERVDPALIGEYERAFIRRLDAAHASDELARAIGEHAAGEVRKRVREARQRERERKLREPK